MGKKRKKIGSGDFALVAITAALVIFGVIMVFSASYYYSIDTTGSPYTFLKKDLVWAFSGFLIMGVTAVVDYHYYRKIAPALMVLSLILLGALFLFGEEINDATRWLRLGPITIMPGEIAKICTIIFVAWFLTRKKGVVKKTVKGAGPMVALAGGVALLIVKQPNLSTAITVVAIVFAMLFIAGIKLPGFFAYLSLGIALVFAYIFKQADYHQERLNSFLDPFKSMDNGGYQVVQGLLAMGSGGFFGLGLGNSLQKNLYLPEPQNDFILAIIAEELGFLALLILFSAYLFLVWKGICISMKAPDSFGLLLGSGITLMIAIQVVFNIAVVTSSMPPTGVTLPFISYGGNALWLFMGSMGILINISRHGKSREAEGEMIMGRRS